MNNNVIYTSQVKVERIKGPHRRAFLPASDHAIEFGVHSEIAAHYNVSPEVSSPRAATLDYVVAATAG